MLPVFSANHGIDIGGDIVQGDGLPVGGGNVVDVAGVVCLPVLLQEEETDALAQVQLREVGVAEEIAAASEGKAGLRRGDLRHEDGLVGSVQVVDQAADSTGAVAQEVVDVAGLEIAPIARRHFHGKDPIPAVHAVNAHPEISDIPGNSVRISFLSTKYDDFLI